jgi:hypothetical protein
MVDWLDSIYAPKLETRAASLKKSQINQDLHASKTALIRKGF